MTAIDLPDLPDLHDQPDQPDLPHLPAAPTPAGPPHLRALDGRAGHAPSRSGALDRDPGSAADHQRRWHYHEASGPTSSFATAAAFIALAVLVQFADVTAAKSTFDVAFNVAEAASWFMAAAVTLAAVVSAFETGRAVRVLVGPDGEDRHRVLHRVAAAGFALLWAGLGLTMFVLRLLEGTFSGDPDVTWRTTWPLATLVGALYALAGATVMAQGYATGNPKQRALRAAERGLRGTLPALTTRRADLAVVDEALAAWHVDVLGRLADERTARLAQVEAARALLADRARLTLATALADPARTTRVLRAAHVDAGPVEA